MNMNSKARRGRHGERGSALMITLVIVTLMIGLVAALSILTQSGSEQLRSQEDYASALDTAQMGISQAVANAIAGEVIETKGMQVGFVGADPDDAGGDTRTFVGEANGTPYTVTVRSAYLAAQNGNLPSDTYMKPVTNAERNDPLNPIFDYYEVIATSDPVGKNGTVRTVQAVLELRKITMMDSPVALYLETVDPAPVWPDAGWLVDGADHDTSPSSKGVFALGSLGDWGDMVLLPEQEALIKSIVVLGAGEVTGEDAYAGSVVAVREQAAKFVGHPDGVALTPYLTPDAEVVDEILEGRIEDFPGQFGSVAKPQVTYISAGAAAGATRTIAGGVNICPSNSDEAEFTLEKPDGSVITRDDLHASEKGFEYNGLATMIRVKPKGNGNSNSLTIDGVAQPLKNGTTYTITGDDMTVRLYNDKWDKNGKAMGQWYVSNLAGTNVLIADEDAAAIEGAGILVIDGDCIFPKSFTFHGVVFVLGEATVNSPAPPEDQGPGLAGGHFDVDTSSSIAKVSKGSTDGHVHEYDDKHDVTGINAFNMGMGDSKAKLHDITADIPAGGRFKIIVANADLSPGGVLIINGTKTPVAAYDDTALADLPIYTLGDTKDATKLTSLEIDFDVNAIADGKLLPTNTGDVRKNIPGKFGEWRNGALTLQAVEVDAEGKDAFTTDVSKSGGGVQGVATGGLLWETTLFWHWDGVSYHDPKWDPNAAPEEEEEKKGKKGKKDPKKEEVDVMAGIEINGMMLVEKEFTMGGDAQVLYSAEAVKSAFAQSRYPVRLEAVQKAYRIVD